MKIHSLLFAFVFGYSSLLIAQTKVPTGTPPLLDGRIDKAEWDGAAVLPLRDFGRVYIKQSDDFVWIAIELLQNPTGTVDLYLSPPDGSIYDLHSSAKLGERKLSGIKWPQEWHWWNNEGWAATVSRVDSWDRRTFVDQPGREFQISKLRFPGKSWRLMFDIMTPAEPNWQTTRFPQGTSDVDTKGWYEVLFNN